MIHHTRKPEDAHLDGAQPAFCVMKPLQQHIAGQLDVEIQCSKVE